MLDRVTSALLAIGLASMIWLQTRNRDIETLSNVNIPCEISLPQASRDEFQVNFHGKPFISATFQAQPRKMRELELQLRREDTKIRLEVPLPQERLAENAWDEVFVVESDMIPLRLPGVTITVDERKNRIPYSVTRMTTRELPVRLVTSLGVPVTDVVLDPPTAMVRGPREALQNALFIPTKPVTADTTPGTAFPFPPRIPLVEELEKQRISTIPATVGIRQLAKPQKTYEIADVPIQFLCPPSFTLKPRFNNDRDSKLTVRVRGPIQDQPPAVYAFVDLTKARALAGLTTEPVQVFLPQDFQFEQDLPRKVGIELVAEGQGKNPPAPLNPPS